MRNILANAIHIGPAKSLRAVRAPPSFGRESALVPTVPCFVQARMPGPGLRSMSQADVNQRPAFNLKRHPFNMFGPRQSMEETGERPYM